MFKTTSKTKAVLISCISVLAGLTLISAVFGIVLLNRNQNQNSAEGLSLIPGTVFQTIASGFNNWNTVPQNSNNLWTLLKPSPGKLLPAGVSGQSYQFFNPATNNYNNGQTVSGSLVTPIINLPSGPGSITTSLTHIVRTESNLDFDQMTITASTSSPNSSKVIWSKGDLQNQVADADFLTFVGETELNLNEFAGQSIQLSFNFDSRDALFNDYSGWEIKDLYIIQEESAYSSSSSSSQIVWQPTSYTDWQKQNIQEPQATVKENLWNSQNLTSPSLTYKNTQNNNYETGRVANGGLITSPIIRVPTNQELDFKFNSIFNAESDLDYDKATIKILTDGIELLLDKHTLISNGSLPTDRSMRFFSRSGTIQIQFSFDTVDALYNSTAGWEVKGLRIETV